MNIEELKQKAEAGSLAAQSMLGTCYLHGIDLAVDFTEAFRLLSKASERGAARASLNLAEMFHRGLGVQQNTAEATRLYEIAAEKGEFFAQVALGRIYSSDEQAPRDMQSAEKWYAAAAAQAGRVANCEELAEAQAFVAKSGGPPLRTLAMTHAWRVASEPPLDRPTDRGTPSRATIATTAPKH
jgi:Sel1 repeat